MEAFEELVRDAARISETLAKVRGQDGGIDWAHVLAPDLQRLAARVTTLVPAHDRLLRDRPRIEKALREAVERFIHGSEPLIAAPVLREVVERLVLPYARSAAYEETTPRIPPVEEALESIEGKHVDRWQLLERIGIGGTSVVHRARHSVSGLIGCAKLIPIVPMQAKEQEERFLREIKVPAQIRHPALVTVYDGGTNQELGVFYIVMELLEGVQINAWARRKPQRAVLDVFFQLLDGLSSCHELDYVHRDLKPSNILVTVAGRARILDFGHATITGRVRHTRTGQFLGTVNYASPEQTRDAKAADARSDVWSLGVLLYELLTGLTVFPQETEADVIAAVMMGQFAPPEAQLPAPLAAVVRRCLSMDPKDRYASAVELAKALSTGFSVADTRGEMVMMPEPMPRQPVKPPSYVVDTSSQVAQPRRDVPFVDPVISPYTLQFDTCDFCRSAGAWSGNRCAMCGRDRGTH